MAFFGPHYDTTLHYTRNMPKNKGKGGKGKRKGKRNKGGESEKAELRFKVFGEEYAQVRKVLGNCRVECYCFDGKTRLCHVRGKFKKRVWINKDDFVLVGLRDYQDDKGDIIHKYSPEEARTLRAWGEIPADKASFEDDGSDIEEEEFGLQPNENHALSMSSDDSDDDSDDDDSDDDSDSDIESRINNI
eukprot:TRINITY_DN1550_c0_g1_i1.p1 TRINITY_DN1550_c0_g1~~TRINITY_DN1550_c0_g1_i1.p1  ORF type:complete len:189 (+),score=45.91 TRINITY_DN1550_c0_g1_i1:54-620(+)